MIKIINYENYFKYASIRKIKQLKEEYKKNQKL